MHKLKNNKKIKLLILAGGDFAPYEYLVKKFGISKQVIVKKNIKDIENYINAGDLGVHTSEEESFGMAILETMSYGKPVLATNVGGVKEVVEHGKTGYLFGVGKVNDFASKISDLIKDAPKLKLLGENAKLHAESNFCAQKIVTKYEEYYKKIINLCK
jgi:glycosyltransferase involved in cell wall biosynthesis